MSERLWFKIGEAAKFAGVSTREVRYWEKIIPEIAPRRSKGNLRHYHKNDLPKLRSIASWLKGGYTVSDCRELLLKGGITRDLGLYEEGAGPKATQIKTQGGQKPKSAADSGAAPISTGPGLQNAIALLREAAASLTKLLTRLQKPAAKGCTVAMLARLCQSR
jgi:DNA-binding transcriptional MerR regulator